MTGLKKIGEIKKEDTPLSVIGVIVEIGVIDESLVDAVLQLNVIEIVHQQNYKMIKLYF